MDQALNSRYGHGFDLGTSNASFCVANGEIATASKSYTALFKIPGRGHFTFSGSAMACGDDPRTHTPILFGNNALRLLEVQFSHHTGWFYSNVLGVGLYCTLTPTGHWSLPILDLLDLAGAVLQPSKNGHPPLVRNHRQ